MSTHDKSNGPVYGFLLKWLAGAASYLILGIFFPAEGTLHPTHAIVLGFLFSVAGSVVDWYAVLHANRFAATLIDIVLGAVVTWVGDTVFYGMQVSLTFLVLAGLLLGFFEFFYHFYFVRKPRQSGAGDYPGNGP